MPKRFEPNRRLLTTLIGSNLYGAPDACIRELIQNAWDAIQLRKTDGDGKGGIVQVDYSISERWFEVIDDGLGMDQRIIEESFLQIGQDKLDVLGIGSRDNQIGYFGIGVLSIFLIAERFEVTTKHWRTNESAISFTVTGVEDEIELLASENEMVGTRIKVFPRTENTFDIGAIRTSISRYARHVDGICIKSVDDGTQESLAQSWATDGFSNVKELENFPGLIGGRFGMNPALRENTGTLSNEITICNAGFLAEEGVNDLIPNSNLGMIGEIDLKPDTLTIGISRERMKRDERWERLGTSLEVWLVRRVLHELNNGYLEASEGLDSEETKRNLLLWYHFFPESEPYSELRSIIETRIFETIPFKVAETKPSSLKNLCARPNIEKLYFRRIGRGTERTETIDDDGLPIRISQEIRDSIRVSALRANGFDVIELGEIAVNIRNEKRVETQRIGEPQLVEKSLRSHGVSLIDIVNAEQADMDLTRIEKLPILNDALSVASGLRFASVEDSMRRVITDSTNTKYINLRNSDVQQILRVVPQAVSNPLKNKLLEAYLKIETFQLKEARLVLMELLKDNDLNSLAVAEIAPFTEKHIESLVSKFLAEME